MSPPNPHSLVLLACCVLCLAAPSLRAAGWSTNAWPPSSHPRNIDVALSDCWSGVWERVEIQGLTGSGGGLATSLSWWRSNRANLQLVKNWFSLMITSGSIKWVPTNACLSAANSAQALNDNGGNWPVWNIKTQFLAQLRFPTNYLEYTPWRSIFQPGYGYVTSETLAGGTNFPSGRTNWISTDYGLARLPELVNALRSTTVPDIPWTNTAWAWGLGQSTNWAQAKTIAETNYQIRTSTYPTEAGTSGWGWWRQSDNKYFYGTKINNAIRSYYPASMLVERTNTYHLFVSSTHISYPPGVARIDVGNPVFDSIDFPSLVLTNYAFVGSGTNRSSVAIGSTNRPSVWCADPGVDPSYGDGLGGYIFGSTLGCDIYPGQKAIRHWAVTNGLRYY